MICGNYFPGTQFFNQQSGEKRIHPPCNFPAASAPLRDKAEGLTRPASLAPSGPVLLRGPDLHLHSPHFLGSNCMHLLAGFQMCLQCSPHGILLRLFPFFFLAGPCPHCPSSESPWLPARLKITGLLPLHPLLYFSPEYFHIWHTLQTVHFAYLSTNQCLNLKKKNHEHKDLDFIIHCFISDQE